MKIKWFKKRRKEREDNIKIIKIRKLASQTLNELWLPAFMSGNEEVGGFGNCCFCDDAECECNKCLIGDYRESICDTIYYRMHHIDIGRIVNMLKKIKKDGKL